MNLKLWVVEEVTQKNKQKRVCVFQFDVPSPWILYLTLHE
jgi:hypothetical protein